MAKKTTKRPSKTPAGKAAGPAKAPRARSGGGCVSRKASKVR